MSEKIKDYMYDHFMDFEMVGPVIKIGDETLIHIDKDQVLDENMALILDASDDQLAEQYADSQASFVFEFGGRYYTRPCDEWASTILNPFFMKGKAVSEIQVDFVNLGVHGRYELMNGTRDYKDWCKKANFFEQDALGICEKGTLAGTLSFQMACNSAGIQPIIGETLRVDSIKHGEYIIKLYATNDIGWNRLLNMNRICNIDNSGYIKDEDVIRENGEGLICVLSPTKSLTKRLINDLKEAFDECYFQIDMSEYSYEEKELEALKSMKKWYENYMDIIQPVLINDCYYLEPEDARIKKILNKSGVKGEHESSNQHYKHIEELFIEWSELWDDDKYDDMLSIFKRSVRNTGRIAAKCTFEINTKDLHLPKYEMTEEESKLYKDNDEMIDRLLEEGVERLTPLDATDEEMEEIWERIDYEMSVIRKGGYVDYFLITRDIINWANSNGIITGIGRGSAAGCAVSYYTGIVLMNPMKYNLLFERFLNESRLEGSMPDIDIDFPGDRRDEVKHYMEERFGGNHVASIGTYVTLQLKAAFQEMSRLTGSITDAGTRNYLSELLNESHTWEDIFKTATETPQIKKLILKDGNLINNIQLCLGTPKSQGVHACATVVVPKFDKHGNETTIFDYVPMRKTDEGMLVSEWEGPQMEAAGFLKEDILGIRQLEKFSMIFDMVMDHDGTNLYPIWQNQDINVDDKEVYRMFSEGNTSDVFQFSGQGMTRTLKELQPDNIEDLIAANALYRPGPMEYIPSYIKRKKGEEEVEYDIQVTEDILEQTYGIVVYQEQVMQMSQLLAGFSKSEADNLRKAMGKKKRDVLDKMKERFIEGGTANGHDQQKLSKIWTDWEAFAQYAFNKSHAAAYAMTAYWCQWLKVHYPTEFWTASLTYAKEEKIPPFINEILRQGSIKVMPPDVNSSDDSFTADIDGRKIFWSLSKISHLGVVAVENILKERLEEGKFFDISEFIERVDVNKTVVNNLILSGSFDDMYNIKSMKDRVNIMDEYNKLRWKGNSKVVREDKAKYEEKYKSPKAQHDWFWYIEQRRVSGMAHMDNWHKVMGVNITPNTMPLQRKLVDGVQFHDSDSVGKNLLVCGFVVDIEERKTKKGDLYSKITIDCNYIPIKITLWSDTYTVDGNRDKLKDAKGKIIFLNGKVMGPDKWNDQNTIQSVGDNFRGSDPGNKTKIDIVG